MSAPPGPPLKVFVCPRCGKQLLGVTDGCVDGHENTKAEEVEVIPVADAQKLEAEAAIEQDRLEDRIGEQRQRAERAEAAARFTSAQILKRLESRLLGGDSQLEYLVDYKLHQPEILRFVEEVFGPPSENPESTEEAT